MKNEVKISCTDYKLICRRRCSKDSEGRGPHPRAVPGLQERGCCPPVSGKRTLQPCGQDPPLGACSCGAAFQVERSGTFFQLLCLLGLEKSRSDGTALQRQPLGSPPHQLRFCCWVLVRHREKQIVFTFISKNSLQPAGLNLDFKTISF